MSSNKGLVFCAFCKVQRKVYLKKHSQWDNFFISALVGICLMYIFWGEFEPKVLLLFVLCLAISELFIQVRWRLSVVCPHCGFDPVLYVKNPKLAENRVKETLAQLEKRGFHWLSSKSPYQRVARRKMARPMASEQEGDLSHNRETSCDFSDLKTEMTREDTSASS